MILNLEKDGHAARILPGGRIEAMNEAQRVAIRYILASQSFELMRKDIHGHFQKAEAVRPRDPEWLGLMGCVFRRHGWDVRVDLRSHRLDPEPEAEPEFVG